jgi:hypothetical protein
LFGQLVLNILRAPVFGIADMAAQVIRSRLVRLDVNIKTFNSESQHQEYQYLCLIIKTENEIKAENHQNAVEGSAYTSTATWRQPASVEVVLTFF